MFVVETSGRRRLRGIFYSLLWLGIIMIPLALVGVYLLHRPAGNLMAAFAGIIMLRLGDFIVKDTVRKIEIAPDEDVIRFHLKSALSGSSEKSFPLKNVKSKIKYYHGWKRIYHYSTVLRIGDSANQLFVITPRYGFSPEDLQKVHDRLSAV